MGTAIGSGARRRLAVAAFTTLVGALSACGGDGGSHGAETTASTATPTPIVAAVSATATVSTTPTPVGQAPLAWAAGGRHVLRSDDGGFTWSVALIAQVNAVAFVDRRDGWVAAATVDAGSLFHTVDEGDTWTDEAPTIDGVPPLFFDVAAIDHDHAVAVGSTNDFHGSGDFHRGPPQIAFTRNGGAKWDRAVLVDLDPQRLQDVALLKVCTTSSGVGLATGTDLATFTGTIALLTRDGGATWVDVSAHLPSVLFAQVACAAGSHLWYGGTSHLLHSGDAGETWEDLSASLPGNSTIGGIKFLDPRTGWLVTDATPGVSGHTIVALRTIDGGANWEQHVVASGLGELTLAIDVLDELRGVVVAQDLHPLALGRSSFGLTFATADGGATWTETVLPSGVDAVWDVQLLP